MRRLSILLIFQIVLAGAASPVARAQELKGRYIVVLKNGSDPDTAANRHGNRYGVLKKAVFRSALNGYSASIAESRVDELRSDPAVASVYPDHPARAASQMIPTGIRRSRAAATAEKGTGVNVAVLDTGIDVDHSDLAGNIVGGKNCSDGSSYNDTSYSGHGTHVAGILAALDNSTGVRGVAPEAKLWSVRVLDATGSGDYSTLICGLDYVDSKSPAKGGPITLLNMSIEAGGVDDGDCGLTNGDPLHQAICRVVADGVTVVVAAGNDSRDLKSIVPAAYDEVIATTALSDSDGLPCGLGGATSFGMDDRFTSFSNYATTAADKGHTIGAPGAEITSTLNDGGYGEMSGTSMASPHLAGAAALYIAEHPGSTPAAVLAGLKAAGEAPGVDFNGECGGGSSHTDPSGKHAEVVVAVTPTIFTVVVPGSATAPVGVQFAGPVSGVDNTNVVLRLASGGSNLPATVTYDGLTNRATLQPAAALLPGQYYAIVVAPAGSTPPDDQYGDPIPQTSVTFRSALLEQENSVWAAPYSWRVVLTTSAYGGRFVTDRTRGASVTFTFSGTNIAWYTMRGPDQGKARVEIDGVVKGEYDHYRSSPQYRYKRSWSLGAGTHTIRIVTLGTKSSASSNYYTTVDSFGVGSTLYSNPTLASFWRTQATSLASGARLVQDSSGGANVYFRFRGTGIDWGTLLGPDQGMAKIYIDGSYKGLFDNFGATTRAYTRAFRGLSDSVHDFRVVVAGTKRSSSTNTTVSVDYWRVV